MTRGKARTRDDDRAVIYVRLSPTPRLTVDANLEQQESLCRELCERKGWPVVDVVVDREVSASKGGRPGWARVLRMIEAGEVGVVVSRHADRMYRQMRDLEDLVDLAESTGVLLATVDSELDLTTTTGRTNARILASIARQEVELKAERQRLGHQRRAEDGRPWWNVRPFGMEKDGTHVQAEADLIRQAFGELLDGHSLYSICARWNREGILTPRGNEWRSSNLRTMLLNPRNAGIHTYRGVPTGKPATWDPIVPLELYEAVERILRAPGRRPDNNGGKRKGLLTNVAVCGKCGSAVGLSKSRPTVDGQRYAKYVCRGCRGISIPADWLDNYVIWSVVMKSHSQEWLDSMAPAGPDGADEQAEALRIERTALEARKRDLAEMFTEGDIDRDALRAGTEKANKRLAEIEQRLSTLVVERVSREHLADDVEYLFHLFATDQTAAEYDKLRSIFSAVIDRIELQPRGKGKRVPTPEDVVVTFKDGKGVQAPEPVPARVPSPGRKSWAELGVYDDADD
jgi:DNA invertase Pin-like site-specific DNA recombinase